MVVAVFSIAFMTGAVEVEGLAIAGLLVILRAFHRFWSEEFQVLMTRRRMSFLVAPIGVWVFRSYRLAHSAKFSPDPVVEARRTAEAPMI